MSDDDDRDAEARLREAAAEIDAAMLEGELTTQERGWLQDARKAVRAVANILDDDSNPHP